VNNPTSPSVPRRFFRIPHTPRPPPNAPPPGVVAFPTKRTRREGRGREGCQGKGRGEKRPGGGGASVWERDGRRQAGGLGRQTGQGNQGATPQGRPGTGHRGQRGRERERAEEGKAQRTRLYTSGGGMPSDRPRRTGAGGCVYKRVHQMVEG
jgi:hypothetical protein